MMTASPALSLIRHLPGAGIVVVLATAIYWLLRQDHLYLDGSIALGFLTEEGDVPSYWGYFYLARLFVRCVSPLGLTPHEAGCLFSGVMAARARVPPSTPSAPAFTEVVLAAPPARAEVEVVLRDGRVMRVPLSADGHAVRRLIAALEAPGC